VKEAALRDAVEITLQELREMAGKTQTEVADVLERTQSELSKIERRRDLLLSTLREYIEALGGRLEVRAVLDDRSLVVNPLLTDEKTAA
jgi:transcriptional regulator with XRE-family HTH domain